MHTIHFTLYSRSYCHLCQDMHDALLRLQPAGMTFVVDVVDIDHAAEAGNTALLERYDELVPVLFADLEQPALCHYFLDEQKILALLR